jgi:hypothetical protein
MAMVLSRSDTPAFDTDILPGVDAISASVRVIRSLKPATPMLTAFRFPSPLSSHPAGSEGAPDSSTDPNEAVPETD